MPLPVSSPPAGHQEGTRRCLNGRDRCLRLHTACSARLLFEAAPAKCFPSPRILPRAHLAQLASAQVGLGCNLDLHCVISSSMPSSPKALCSGVCCTDTHVSTEHASPKQNSSRADNVWATKVFRLKGKVEGALSCVCGKLHVGSFICKLVTFQCAFGSDFVNISKNVPKYIWSKYPLKAIPNTNNW